MVWSFEHFLILETVCETQVYKNLKRKSTILSLLYAAKDDFFLCEDWKKNEKNRFHANT